jgi:hypothetical protein
MTQYPLWQQLNTLKVETSPFSNSLKRGISGSNVCVKSTQVACFKVFNCCHKGYKQLGLI